MQFNTAILFLLFSFAPTFGQQVQKGQTQPNFKTAPAQSTSKSLPRFMKGYELYSWQTRGQWYFSLIVGTNREKSYHEITSRKVRVKGIERLKKRLDQLPRGEEINWSTHRKWTAELLPQAIANEIVAYCQRQGLILRLI